MNGFSNNTKDIPNAEFTIIRQEFETIDAEYALGLVKVDDVRVRLSKLYNQVDHKNSKKFVLDVYDSLDKVKR